MNDVQNEPLSVSSLRSASIFPNEGKTLVAVQADTCLQKVAAEFKARIQKNNHKVGPMIVHSCTIR